jgi:hypothetical protein
MLHRREAGGLGLADAGDGGDVEIAGDVEAGDEGDWEILVELPAEAVVGVSLSIANA